MADTTIKKVSSDFSPKGEMGQIYLASGKRVSLRLWRDEEPQAKEAVRRDYETVGYVISGRAELTVEGQPIKLEPGDSWLVPAGAEQLSNHRNLHGRGGDGTAGAGPRTRRGVRARHSVGSAGSS